MIIYQRLPVDISASKDCLIDQLVPLAKVVGHPLRE